MSSPPISEADLHAYVDEALPAARIAEVEAYLAERPEEAARIAAYREHAHALRREFSQVLNEPVPRHLTRLERPSLVRRCAASVALLTVGGALGWQLHSYLSARQVEAGAWARRAAVAHVIYSPEVRHPVEVGADQEAHLVAWLSKRLGTPLKIPHLAELGYGLVGGRLLPGDRGPVAQFMYQDARGVRLTLYVRADPEAHRETAFRFSQEQGISVFYWLDDKLGYALSGEIDKKDLLRVAEAVYRQLNP